MGVSMGVRRCCRSESRGCSALFSSSRLYRARLSTCSDGQPLGGARAQRAWPPRVVSGYVRPGEGRARRGGEGGEASGVLDRETGQYRTGPRGRKVGGSVRANCPGVCQSRPSDSPRSLSPERSVLARALGGSDVDEDGAQDQEQDEREEIESRRAGRERPSAVDVGRGGPILCCTCTGAASTGRERALWLAGVGAPAAKATCATVAGR